jgi:hypothetical protein
MSKGVLGAVLLIAAVAIPVVGPLIGLTAAATMAITAGLALASSVLLAPKIPKGLTETRDRLHASFDLTAPRKIVFGRTAMATDIRYHAYSGTKQEFYHQIVCVASHEVNAIEEIWLDNEKAWTAAGGAQGRFVNYLTVTTRLVGQAGNAITVDSNWNSTATLTGCAHLHIRYRLTGTSDKQQSPFAGGVSGRMTIRGKGAKVYDPRLDSTAGGSGSQRANDQSTWAWNDNASRNPALQLLFYLLGWRINGKLAVGMGLPPARIDLQSFITAANICDESVSLSGGGGEPRYRSDGVISEGDDRQAVIENLCSAMNAILRDAGGKIALNVVKNDLASPSAHFTIDDILGDELWEQTPPLTQSFNIIRGRWIDPSDTALYQPVDFPEVGFTSLDGIDRIQTVDYPLVQSPSQAQRLAKQRLQRLQYQGRYSAVFGPRAWAVSLGEVVELSHEGLGWSQKLFRIIEQTVDQSGQTKMTLLEEHPSIYAWDAEEAPAVTPGTPTIYDPLNSPLLNPVWELVVGDEKPEDKADITRVVDGPSLATFKHAHDGTAESGQYPRNLLFKLMATQGQITSGVTWKYVIVSGTVNGFAAGSTERNMSGTGTGTFTVSSLESNEARVEIRGYWNGAFRVKTVHLLKEFAAPPTGGGGGSSTLKSKTSGWSTVNSTSFVVISGTDLHGCTLPSGKTQLDLSATLEFSPDPDLVGGNWMAETKWQLDISGTWTDVGSPAVVSGSTHVDAEGPSPAYITNNKSITGLTAGTTHDLRVVARTTTGPAVHFVTGNASVVAP